MNISNLQVNYTYNNYKQMCIVLEVKPKTGNSKKAQLKEWERHFDYRIEGHKYIINSIYDHPLDKIENRGGARHILEHADSMRAIITYILDYKEEGELFVPINLLLRIINMVNVNYSYGSRNRKKVSKYLNIEEMIIEEFFDSSRQTFRNNIESVLNKLENKSAIYWSKVKTVCVANARTPTNENGDIKVYSQTIKDKYDNEETLLDIEANVRKQFREATSYEIDLILETEVKIMDKLNCESKQEVIVKKKWDTFAKEVNKILQDKANILFYYDSYKINRNMDKLSREVEKLQNELLNDFDYEFEKLTLNLDVQKQLLTNIMRKQERAFIKTNEGIVNSKIKMRLSPDYLDHGITMIDTFINFTHDDIRENIKQTKLT